MKALIIGTGAMVIKDVPDNAVVVGNPARVLRYNQPAEIQVGVGRNLLIINNISIAKSLMRHPGAA